MKNRPRMRKRFWLPGLVTVAGLFILLIALNDAEPNPEESAQEMAFNAQPRLMEAPDTPISEQPEPSSDEVDEQFDISKFVPVLETYQSLDGTYIAYLGRDEEEIFINKEDQPHYISKNSWKAPWTVQQIRWVSDEKLYYVLYHTETEEYQYWLINLEDRSENQLEGPLQENQTDLSISQPTQD